jgi:CDP-diacylglycerol---serine O-phosphatidyltransferase
MQKVFPPFLPEKLAKGRKMLLAAKQRKVPVRALVPNIVTLLGLCAGLTAIRMAFEGRFENALIAIVLAAVLDGVDGRMARLLKASSRFGAELDSLADFVNFGVAPALTIYAWGLSGGMRGLGWISVLVFALAMALRLARFNVGLDAPAKPLWQTGFFTGMPAPAGALTVLLPIYLEGLGIPHEVFLAPVVMAYISVIAFLMVSRLPTFSGKLGGQRIEREYVLPLFVAAVLVAALLLTYPYLTLTLGSLTYLAALPYGFKRYREASKAWAEELKRRNGASIESKANVTPPSTSIN